MSQAGVGERFESFPRWPVVLLAMGAFVAIWGGWVDLGRMVGFGPVNVLPGIVELVVDLSITLPFGMEAYSAYALGVLLTHRRISPAARRFAGWSVAVSLLIGAGGQVAYHLLKAAGLEAAPWPVVVVVACVPVAVLGMGGALAHLLTAHRPPAHLAQSPSQDTDHGRGTGADAGGPAPVVETMRPALQVVPTHEPAVPVATGPAVHTVSPQAGRPGQLSRATAQGVGERDAAILAAAATARTERDLAAQVPWSRSTVNRVLRKHGIRLGQPDQPTALDLPTSAHA